MFVVPDDYDGVYASSPHLDRLRPRGPVRVYGTPPRDEAELLARLVPARVLIPIRERTPITAARLAALPDLRLISMTGTGVASLDVAAATAGGVVITNTPGASASAVVELTFGLAIACLRRIPAIDGAIRQGEWPEVLGTELHGRILGVVGLGEIGRRVAGVGRAFGMDVLAWSRRLTPEAAAVVGARAVPLAEVMAAADVVSVHVRANAESLGLVSRELIGRMKPGAILINTARASVVDEDALHAALAAGRLGGAGLDVFGEEPLPREHRWAALDNVVLTSHRGWTTRETLDRFLAGAVDNALAFLDGRPQHVVNPEALTRARH
ncbi:MAG TPA: D-2-hydroxyacid dehydrogenase family protein [Methylomirabilota bacterium]|nr:D-2-hydroxyacid dehydrogenase family protein [Methylomirabilota bacterium]